MEITRQIDEFEAVQYVGDNADEVVAFIGLEAQVNDAFITIKDTTGDWYVYVDQWVLRTLDKEVLGTVDKDHFWDSFATIDDPIDDL